MTHHPPYGDLESFFAQALHRRRLIAGIGAAAAAAGLVPSSALAAQTATPATPSADQTRVDRLIALSQSLCGGGTFDSNQAATLLSLLASDAELSRGLDELLMAPKPGVADPRAATQVAATPSPNQAATQAILLFWYAGYFKGSPVPDHETIYSQLLAWQAMYTPAWATCKVYGAWADPPPTAPQVPENA